MKYIYIFTTLYCFRLLRSVRHPNSYNLYVPYEAKDSLLAVQLVQAFVNDTYVEPSPDQATTEAQLLKFFGAIAGVPEFSSNLFQRHPFVVDAPRPVFSKTYLVWNSSKQMLRQGASPETNLKYHVRKELTSKLARWIVWVLVYSMVCSKLSMVMDIEIGRATAVLLSRARRQRSRRSGQSYGIK